MKTICSDNFFIGFNNSFNSPEGNPHQKGVLYYKSQPFANVWVNPKSHLPKENAGKWTINRDDVALMYNFPNDCDDFESIESLLTYCEVWAKDNIDF